MVQKKGKTVISLVDEFEGEKKSPSSYSEQTQDDEIKLAEDKSLLNTSPGNEKKTLVQDQKGKKDPMNTHSLIKLKDLEQSIEKTVADIVSQAHNEVQKEEKSWIIQPKPSNVSQKENSLSSVKKEPLSESSFTAFKASKKSGFFSQKNKSKEKRKKSTTVMTQAIPESTPLALKTPKELLNQPFVLTLSNNLKLAEKKIKKLEESNTQLRLENQKLVLSGEALQDSLDKLSQEYQTIKSDYVEGKRSWVDQKKLLEQALSVQNLEIKNLKSKTTALEKHLERDVKKVRVKERELENKLELKKDEIQSIVRDKDKILLKLKMDLELLKEKIKFYMEDKKKTEEMIENSKDKSHRVVRALQMCLHLLQDETEKTDNESSAVVDLKEEKQPEKELNQSEEPSMASMKQAS